MNPYYVPPTRDECDTQHLGDDIENTGALYCIFSILGFIVAALVVVFLEHALQFNF